MNHQVIFKGTKDGITIIFHKDVDFEILCDTLKEKIKKAKKFFKEGSETSMAFRGRNFTEEEERTILDILIEYTKMEIVFVRDFGLEDNSKGNLVETQKENHVNENNNIGEKINTKQINTEQILHKPIIRTEKTKEEVEAEEYNIFFANTLYHKGSLRSGQTLTHKGSIVLIGDVNPGAEVRATGNIVVVGILKGMAHAGYGGREDAFITAIYMAPVQLRIGDLITTFPDERKKGAKPPEYAFIKDDQVCVMRLL